MYNLDQSVSENTNSYLPVGLHENVMLKDITLEKASNGNPYLKFLFEAEDGSTVAHTEWPIDEADPAKLQKKVKNFLVRIKHICTKFVPAEKVNINAPDFEGFANQVIAIVKPNITNVKLRIKVVYNYRNFPSIPKYLPFVEPMTVEKEKSRLKIDPSFDKMVKEEGNDPAMNSGSAPATPGLGTADPIGDDAGDDGAPF